MADFDIAVNFVLKNEGGYVDNPNDSGGCTNWGISLRFLRGLPPERLKAYGLFGDIDVEHVRSMPLEQAKAIYKGEFWDNAPFEKIPHQLTVNALFDACVIHGISEGIKIFQRALWAVVGEANCINDDGILGSKTLQVWSDYSKPTALAAFMAERAGFMRLIAQIQTKDKEFLNGWITRAYRC